MQKGTKIRWAGAGLVLAGLAAMLWGDYETFGWGTYTDTTGYLSGFNQNFRIGGNLPPDGTSEYELKTTFNGCWHGWNPNIGTQWDAWTHILRATPDFPAVGSSGYAVIVDSRRCGQDGAPRLKISGGTVYQSTLLEVDLPAIPTQMTSRIRNVGTQSVITATVLGIQYEVTVPQSTGLPGVSTSPTLMAGYAYGLNYVDTEMRALDRTPPPAPASLQTFAWPNAVDVQWPIVNDVSPGSGVCKYRMSRNGAVVSESADLYGAPVWGGIMGYQYTFGGLTPGTSYTLAVAAVDCHGNVGAVAQVVVMTPTQSTNVPLVPTRTGVHRYGTTWGASDLGESIDTRSGNVAYAIPLGGAVTRAGGSVPFGLVNNSQIWRRDGSLVKKLTGDVGYGYGWRMQFGALTPVWNASAFSHWVFTDATGAEYALTANSNGVWESRDGIYLAYDTNTRRLRFYNGSFWQMDCVSGGPEQDAGTRYPTRIQDSNGNYVEVNYQPAMGTTGSNTSARMTSIRDHRWTSGAMFYFYYTNETLPHLDRIQEAGVYGNSKTMTYTTLSMTDPFVGGSYGSVKVLATVAHAAPGVSYSFLTNAHGELYDVQLPKGGRLKWDYVPFTFSTNITAREVGTRRLVKQVGAPDVNYSLVRPASDTSQPMHTSLEIADPSTVGRKKWGFSSVADWTRGLVTQLEEFSAASGGTLLRRHVYGWTRDTNLMPYLQAVNTTIDPGTANSRETRTEQTVDVYGNVTQTRIFEWNSLTTPARTVNCTYFINVAAYLRSGLATGCSVTEGGTTWNLFGKSYGGTTGAIPNASGLTMHDTANYGLGFTDRGNVTAVSSKGKQTNFTYNVLGEVTRATDLWTGRTVDYSFTSATNWSAPSQMTPNSNSNLQTNMNWDSVLRPTTTSSPNGAGRSQSYDLYGRPSQWSNADGETGAVTRDDFAKTETETSTTGAQRKTTFDGLGRPIKIETTGGVVDIEYDSCACSPVGKLKRQSLPYAAGGSPAGWTTYTYDGLGRTLSVAQPYGSGTTTYAYAGETVTVTDPAGRWKKYTMDARGRLVQVTEPNPVTAGQTYETYYTYNAYDALTRVRMPRPNQFGGVTEQNRYFNYDAANPWRLTSVQQPENGTTSYTYLTGEVLQRKTEANGNKTEYSYDGFGRVTQITKKNAADQVLGCETVQMVYDQWVDGYGRPTTVKWGNSATSGTASTGQPSNVPCAKGLHAEEYRYTAMGRVTSKTVKVTRKYPNNPDLPEPKELTASMVIAYSYSQGRAAQTTYPTTYTQAAAPPFSPTNPNAWVAVVGPRFELSYDGNNRLAGETKADWNGAAYGSPATLVSGVAYNINSQMTSMTVAGGNPYNGGYTETRQYNSLYQLTRLTAGSLDEQYTYSATQNDGRIASKIASGEEVVYQYDALQRLVSAVTVGPQWGMSWVYDGFGNRTAQNVVKGSVPVQSVSVDMNTNRITTWGYDANGNATSIPGVGTITYDGSNRVKTVGSETYEYDPSNKRIWKNDTYTFWGARGERVGTYSVQLMQYLPEGQQTQVYQLSFVKGTEDWYFGGRRLQVTDRLGSVGGGNNYYPYGEERSATANPADKFATYHRDGTGLDYADQRYYHAGSGRFISSDPYMASGGPAAPGSWNRYAYVSGDPVNYHDPSGLMELQPCPNGSGFTINGCGPGTGGGGGGGGGGGDMQDPGAGPGSQDTAGGGGGNGLGNSFGGPEMQRVRERIREALGKDDCKDLFNTERLPDLDVAALMDTILSGQQPNVTVRLREQSFFGSQSAAGTATPLIDEHGNVIGGQINLLADLWNSRELYSDRYGIEAVFGAQTQDVYRAITVLHELGHLFYHVPAFGGSRILPDAGSFEQSDANSRLILEKCFQWW